MIGNVGEHMAQPSLGVDPVELCRVVKRVDGGGALATAFRADAQVVAAVDGDTGQHPVSGRLINFTMPLSQ